MTLLCTNLRSKSHIGLGLCPEIETYKISVLVLILRLRKCQPRTQSQNWDLEKLSLILGLEIETLKFTVSTRFLWIGDWYSMQKILERERVIFSFYILNYQKIFQEKKMTVKYFKEFCNFWHWSSATCLLIHGDLFQPL